MPQAYGSVDLMFLTLMTHKGFKASISTPRCQARDEAAGSARPCHLYPLAAWLPRAWMQLPGVGWDWWDP